MSRLYQQAVLSILPILGAITLQAPLVPIYEQSPGGPQSPGDRLLVGSYVPPNWQVEDLVARGVSFFHGQTDELAPPDGGDGKFDPGLLAAQKEAVEKAGARWGLTIHTLFPRFEDSLIVGEGTVKLGTSERVPAWSPWDLDRTRWSANQYGWVNRRLPGLHHVALGVFGEYGDASFFTGLAAQDPAQAARWRTKVRVDPPTLGFWAGDPKALASWQDRLIESHGSIENAYRDWGMEVPDPVRVPTPFAAPYPYAARTEFMAWYRSAIPQLASRLSSVAREIFVGLPILIPIGPPHDMPELGVDAYRVLSAVQGKADGAIVTNAGYYDFAANWVLSLGRIRAASRATGSSLWVSSPSPGTTADAEQRLFEVYALGARAFVEWPQTLRMAGNPVERNFSLLQWYPPECDVALLYPSTSQALRPGQPAPRLFYRGATDLRDYADFDVLEESAVASGALARYRVAVLYEGTVWTPEALNELYRWVQSGGVVVAYDFGKMATPDGDTTVYQELFGFASSLGRAEPTERWVGSLPPAYRVVLPGGLDKEVLLGFWGAASSEGRGAYDGAQLRLPIQEAADTIVALRFGPIQSAATMTVLAGEQQVASVSLTPGLKRFQFTIPATAISRNIIEITLQMEGNVPVPITTIEVRPASQPDAEVAELSGRYDAPIRTEDVRAWSRRVGNGLAIFFPGRRQLWKEYSSVVRHAIYRLSAIEGGRKDAPLLDDRADGVYVVKAGPIVAALNGTPEEQSVTVGPGRSVPVPAGQARLIWTGEPETQILLQAEDFAGESFRVQASPDGIPFDRPNVVRVEAGEKFEVRLEVPKPGRYRLFLRTFRGGQLYPVGVTLSDGTTLPPPQVQQDGFTYRIGDFALEQGTLTLTVQAAREFLFDFVALTDNMRIAGYRVRTSSNPSNGTGS